MKKEEKPLVIMVSSTVYDKSKPASHFHNIDGFLRPRSKDVRERNNSYQPRTS